MKMVGDISIDRTSSEESNDDGLSGTNELQDRSIEESVPFNASEADDKPRNRGNKKVSAMPSNNIENATISKETQGISVPLTPDTIPVSRPQDNEDPSRSFETRTTLDPLDFTPRHGLEGFIKVPGILIFSIVAGYLIGRYRLNLIFLVLVGHIIYYVFNRRVKAYTRTLEKLHRDSERKDSLGEFETVEWMNNTVGKLWEVSEQTVSSIIFNEVNNILKNISEKHNGLAIKLSEITLGTRPPVIERISFLEKAEDMVVLEIAANFIPVQASEAVLAYFKKERTHWNTYIELQVILGNFITIPILVKNFTFSGIFKIELGLSRKLPFVNKLSLSLLEMPVIDFQLIPLKSVDMLDLPYIGGLLDSIMNKQIKSLLLDPKSIEIDLEELMKYRGTVVGVVYVYIHGLESVDESTYWIEADNNGRVFGKSTRKSGKDPIFNEGFYSIVTDTTKYIGVTLKSTGELTRIGRICLRNLNKFIFSEKVHLSEEHSRRYVNVTTQFYPLTKAQTNSIILNIGLISIEDLTCKGEPINKLYSTYCLISLETREALVERKVLVCNESKRIFATKNPFYSQHFSFFIKDYEDYVIRVRLMNERDDTELGTVIIPLSDVQTIDSFKYRISGVESGDLNLEFKVDYVDTIDNEFKPDEVHCSQSNSSIIEGHLDSDPETNNDETSINKLDTSKHKPVDGYVGSYHDNQEVPEQPEPESLSLGIYNKASPKQQFINYKKAYKFTIKNIKGFGTFYLVFETDYLNIKMDTFSTEIAIQREVVVPIENEKFVKVRLFKHSINGDALISEELLDLKDKIVVFDKIRVEFEVEIADFTDYNGVDEDENVKVLQVRINKLNHPTPYSFEYSSNDYFHNLVLVHQKSTFIIGQDNVFCKIMDGYRMLSKSPIPKRNCSEEFNFSNLLAGDLYCKCQVCPFIKKTVYSTGILEVFIIKASSLKNMNEGSCNPSVKVYLNNEKIYKTERKTRNLNPIYNESFKIDVQKNVDVLSFHVYSYATLTVDSLVAYREVALFNLPKGYSRYDISLNDGDNGEIHESSLQVIFNYTGRAPINK